jgi:RNA polymerase sigma-70 factor (ECF subfamily)
MSAPPPPLLLAAARGGDPAAWGPLLAHFRPYLTLLAEIQIGRTLQVKADPDDLVQETFLQAHRAFVDFRGQSVDEFVGWLQAILASRVAKLVRRYCRTEAYDVDREQTLQADLADASRQLDRGLMCSGSSPSGTAARREEMVRVAAAVDGLPPDYRQVILLRQLEGLPFAVVGERMGRSANAATHLWVRALRELQARLGVSRDA